MARLVKRKRLAAGKVLARGRLPKGQALVSNSPIDVTIKGKDGVVRRTRLQPGTGLVSDKSVALTVRTPKGPVPADVGRPVRLTLPEGGEG